MIDLRNNIGSPIVRRKTFHPKQINFKMKSTLFKLILFVGVIGGLFSCGNSNESQLLEKPALDSAKTLKIATFGTIFVYIYHTFIMKSCLKHLKNN
jgi:hypothetical protein